MLTWDSLPVNKMVDLFYEPIVTFGNTWMKHLIRIWNLRISYLYEDILLWDDDATGAFRQIKNHPDIAMALAFIIAQTLYCPTGQTFGFKPSPANWEPVRRAREELAQSLFEDSSLIAKHDNYLSQVKYCAEPDVDTEFVQAVRDKLNQGVLDENGRHRPTEHNMYVDDNLIAEVKKFMPNAQATSIEALFILLSRPEPEFRRVAVCMKKFLRAQCSYRKEQLGIMINTRQMIVYLPDSRVAKMIVAISHFHKGRRSFQALEAAALLGALQNMAQCAQWAKFLFFTLQHSVTVALSKNKKELIKSSRKFAKLTEIANREQVTVEDTKKANFATGKLAKMVWHSDTESYIIPTMAKELALITHILKHPQLYRWEAPIAHLVPRTPDFLSWGDSSLTAAGGFSTDLKFWWFLEWPAEIQSRNIKVSKKNRTGEIISINVLEYATAIITYAAATVAFAEMKAKKETTLTHPVLLNRIDNTSADTWTMKACTSSVQAKALARILSSIMINNPIGLNSEHLAGVLNIIADKLSRDLKTNTESFDFAKLQQEHPELRNCRRFHPSVELLSALSNAVLSNSITPLLEPPQLGLLDRAR